MLYIYKKVLYLRDFTPRNFIMLKTKLPYSAPRVLEKVSVFLDREILVASVVDKVPTIESKGQDIVQYDYSDPSNNFNHTWEN